ncbi:MAG: PHP domain-containing protein [Candidatus Helarchaeota archaeon]
MNIKHPDINANYKNLKKFDLHIHSTCSKHPFFGVDGMCPPKEIIKTALKKGLDGIAVTDHDTVRGSLNVLKIVKDLKLDKKILIIPGAELRSRHGDILALGITQELGKTKNLPGVEVVEKIQDVGGLAIKAHLFKTNFFGSKYAKCSKWIKRMNGTKLNGIETYNGGSSETANNMAEYFALRYGYAKTGGSDAHILSHIGNGLTLIDTELTLDDVLEAVRKKKTNAVGVKYNLNRPIQIYFYKGVQLLRRCFGKGFNHCQAQPNELGFNIFNLQTN